MFQKISHLQFNFNQTLGTSSLHEKPNLQRKKNKSCSNSIPRITIRDLEKSLLFFKSRFFFRNYMNVHPDHFSERLGPCTLLILQKSQQLNYRSLLCQAVKTYKAGFRVLSGSDTNLGNQASEYYVLSEEFKLQTEQVLYYNHRALHQIYSSGRHP